MSISQNVFFSGPGFGGCNPIGVVVARCLFSQGSSRNPGLNAAIPLGLQVVQ